MSFSAGNSGNTAKAIDGIEGATSGAPVSLPSGYIGSPRPATLADANVTLIATSNPDMVMTPTVTRTITLASTSIPANYVVRIVNKSPSVTINVNSSGGGLVAIVAGGSQMTVMSNIPSPTVPADWNTNSYGDAFGPGSSVDNAIVRFDGTTGKLIQNSSATIDDNGKLSLTDTAGNGHVISASGSSAQVIIGRKTASQGFMFIGADSTNAFKLWSGGTGSDTPVSGSSLVEVSQAGAVSFPTSTTHIFGANSAGNTVVSARTATGDHAVFETRRNNAITTAFGIDDSGSYTNATVGSSAFLGTNGATLHFVTGAGFTGSAGNITTGGAWTLGPTTGAGHTVYGTLSIGPTSSNTRPTPSYGLTTFNDSSLSVHWRMFRVSATTIDHYISGTEYQIINASGGVKLTVGATSWAAISDERQKKNISSLEYGLNEVMQINPIRFDYNTDSSEEGKRIGFSAQNLRPIIPESVSEDVEMDVLSASSTELIPVLVKAIQEQQAIIDGLKARIEALENP